MDLACGSSEPSGSQRSMPFTIVTGLNWGAEVSFNDEEEDVALQTLPKLRNDPAEVLEELENEYMRCSTSLDPAQEGERHRCQIHSSCWPYTRYNKVSTVS